MTADDYTLDVPVDSGNVAPQEVADEQHVHIHATPPMTL